MSKTSIELLQGMPIFGGIREDIVGFVLDLFRIVFVGSGGYFFRENDKADSMFVLEIGRVVVLKSWQGSEHRLRTLGPGACFGEMALMDLQPRSASVLAETDCTAIEISSTDLYEVYRKDLEQFALIQMNMGREVSRRLREADERFFRARLGAGDALADYVISS